MCKNEEQHQFIIIYYDLLTAGVKSDLNGEVIILQGLTSYSLNCGIKCVQQGEVPLYNL